MLPDYLASSLNVVFVGTSVATASASRGHYYSGPGNRFWQLLRESGLTDDRLLGPEDDSTVLSYGIGLTAVVKGRAASSDTLLRTSDYGVTEFIEKVATYRPLVIAFTAGKRRVGSRERSTLLERFL